MISIVGTLTTLKPGYTWLLSKIPEPEQTEGVKISFMHAAGTTRDQALMTLAAALRTGGVAWLRPKDSPTNQWIVSLADARLALGGLIPSYPWMRGTATIRPVVGAGGVPNAISFCLREAEMASRREGIFISHVTEEAVIAAELKQFLKDCFGGDLRVFVSSDCLSIAGGEISFQKIVDALMRSEVVLALISAESVGRRWINFESGLGLGAGARVIPIVIDNLSKGDVGPPLSNLQIRDLRDRRDLQGLVNDIEAVTSRRRTSTVDFGSIVWTVNPPTREVMLEPVIQTGALEFLQLGFELSNPGNRDVELVEIEVSVPKTVLLRNWYPQFDSNVVETFERDIGGENCRVLRYKVYGGPVNLFYGEVDRLPRMVARGMSPRILRPLNFPLDKASAVQNASAPIRHKVSGVGIEPRDHVTPLNKIRRSSAS